MHGMSISLHHTKARETNARNSEQEKTNRKTNQVAEKVQKGLFATQYMTWDIWNMEKANVRGCVKLWYILHSLRLHNMTFQYITWHYMRYIDSIASHYATLHYITLLRKTLIYIYIYIYIHINILAECMVPLIIYYILCAICYLQKKKEYTFPVPGPPKKEEYIGWFLAHMLSMKMISF